MPSIDISWGLVALSALAIYVLYDVWYSLYAAPLSKFPGPPLWKISRIPYVVSKARGKILTDLLHIHDKYGPIVCIAPDELSFADARAWRDTMGGIGAGGLDLDKSPIAYLQPGVDIPHHPQINSAMKDDHNRMRKAMMPGFGDRALRAYEPTMRRYVDLLVARLKDLADGKTAVNMNSWYNYTTFDIIGQIGFGEDFGCLDNSRFHPWITMIFKQVRAAVMLNLLAYWPRIYNSLLSLAGASGHLDRMKRAYFDTVEAKLKRRIAAGQGSQEGRNDMMEGILRGTEKGEFSYQSTIHNTSTLLAAGSETSATLLSGATFLLLRHPDALRRATAEVRAAFSSEDGMTPAALAELPYLNAVIQESLRVYPPVADSLPRVTPKEGAVICGREVPGEIYVSLTHWALYHSSAFFADPFGFHPERWMGPEEDPDGLFAKDQRDIFQPFHLGPRNCMGKQFAYIEIRLILARVLWTFDMELAPSSERWMENQAVYLIWQKGPLHVYLKPVAA